MKGLILTYIVTIFGAVSALRYPLIGLYIYVGLGVLRPQFIFGFAGDLSNLSLMVGVPMMIGWAMNGFGSWRFGRSKPIAIALLLFVVWYGLSGLFALNPEKSFEFGIPLLKLVLPLLVGLTMMDGQKDWRPMLWTIVLCQGYVSFEQNINYAIKGYNTAADGFGGMDNNCFGVSLVSVLGPAIALVLSSRTWLTRGLAAASAALILHTTLLTFSRGSLIGLLALLLVAFVMMPKRPKYLATVLVAVLIFARFTGPQLAARYATTFASADDRDASAESRIDLWRDCLLVVEGQPILGVGPANWPVVASQFGWPEGKSAHSVWMETAAEMGIPGVLALLAFFVIAAARLWPVARSRMTDDNRDHIAVATAVVLSVVGFVVAGQFVSVTGLEAPYYIVMVGAAMLKNPEPNAPATVPSSPPAVLLKRPASTVLRPSAAGRGF